MRWPTLALVFCSTTAFADASPASLDRESVIQGMTAIRLKLQACGSQQHVAGVATLDLTIAPSGTVAHAAVAARVAGWGDVPPDSPTAACLVRAVRDARFPAFHGAPMTLAYPIVLGANGPTPDATLDKAQQAYTAGRYAEAIALAQQGRAGHELPAWRMIGASSCFLKDAAGAATAWRALDDSGRKFVAFVCARNEVKLAPH